MIIYVLDTSLDTIAMIEDFYSLTWAERYVEFGDFELEIPIEYSLDASIAFGNFLYLASSEKLMVIEDIKPSFGPDKSSLIIKGRSAESILTRRVLLNAVNLDDVAEDIIYDLIDAHVTSPVDATRRLDIFKDTFPATSTTVEFQDQLEMQSVFDAIETICKDTDLGFKATFIVGGIKELNCIVYEGEDRSYDQGTNPYVIFSDAFDNIISSSFYESEKNKVNIVLVATTDEVPSLQRVFVWEGFEPGGIYRYETSLETVVNRVIGEDAAPRESSEITVPILGIKTSDNLIAVGISTTPVFEISTYIPPLSNEEVLGIINTRGAQVLEINKSVGIFEGDFDLQGNFEYGTDFFMGDIVQCSLEGRNVKARIIELVRSYSTEGEKSYVAFDFII